MKHVAIYEAFRRNMVNYHTAINPPMPQTAAMPLAPPSHRAPKAIGRSGRFLLRRGYTLLEAISVVAVILVIAAILIPTLSSARRSAGEATSIDNLHQLGLAAALYHSDYSEFPVSVQQVIDARYSTSIKLADSPLDTTRDGYANVRARQFEGLHTAIEKPLPFRSSYISLKSFGYGPNIASQLQSEQGGGWLIDPSLGQCTGKNIDWCWQGKLLRLTYETSVIRRPEPWRHSSYQGTASLNIAYKELFFDAK